ncbi:MAG: CBS domain-containing protein [Candidatus Methanofastidiosia archaeon]
MSYNRREIKRLRKMLSITQRELAERAGVTQAYIAKLESGKLDPKLSTLERVSQVLDGFRNDMKKAKDVMKTPIIWVHPYDRVENAIKLMSEHDISQLVVIKGERTVGSVSEKSLIKKIDFGDVKKYGEKRVYELMDDPFPSVSPKESLESVLSLLKNNSAVVVEEKAKPLGIITRIDILGMVRLERQKSI